MYPVIFALYLTAVWTVCRSQVSFRTDWLILVLGAALLRVIILFGAVPENPDLGRHLWEGLVLLEGYNPYAAPPNDEVYDPLRERLEAQGDDLYSGMWTDYADVRSVYGPVATVLFTLPHCLPFDRRVTLRTMMTGFDFLTVLLLGGIARALGRPETWVVVYAWSPVCLNGFADRGQVDAATVVLTVLAVWLALRRRPVGAGIAFAAAVLTKISPLLLLFPLLRLGGWRLGLAFVAMGVAGLLPFAGAGLEGFQGLVAFAERWHQNDSVFSLGAWVLSPWEGAINSGWLARILMAGMALTYTLWRSRAVRETDPLGFVESLISISAAVILLSPVAFPWYTTPLLAFLCFRPRASLLALSAVPMFWYLQFLPLPKGSPWSVWVAGRERGSQLWRWPAYGMVAALALWETVSARRRDRATTTGRREDR